jgi:RNA polymerase sigma-70 factor (ECF subfamily)
MVKLCDNLDLISQARTGDKASLNLLAMYVRQRLSPYLRRSVPDQNVTDDLLQDILIAVIVRIDALADSDRFWPWVYAIARSKICQYLRDRYRRQSQHAEYLSHRCHYGESYSDASENASAAEQQESIYAEVAALDSHYRNVVEMRYYQGMSLPEIASATGCGYQQIRMRFFRAKRTLRTKLLAAGVVAE